MDSLIIGFIIFIFLYLVVFYFFYSRRPRTQSGTFAPVEPSKSWESMNPEQLVTVARYDSAPSAELAKMRLMEDQIESVIFENRTRFKRMAAVTWGDFVELKVRVRDAERAVEILGTDEESSVD